MYHIAKDYEMSISDLKKIVVVKSVIRNYTGEVMSKFQKSSYGVNYDKYVKISPKLDSDTFEYVSSLKSTIGNYARHNNLEIRLNSVKGKPKTVKIDVFAKDNPIVNKIFDILEIAPEDPCRLNKNEIIVKVNPEDKEELIPPSRKIFAAISETMRQVNKTLNKNLG